MRTLFCGEDPSLFGVGHGGGLGERLAKGALFGVRTDPDHRGRLSGRSWSLHLVDRLGYLAVAMLSIYLLASYLWPTPGTSSTGDGAVTEVVPARLPNGTTDSRVVEGVRSSVSASSAPVREVRDAPAVARLSPDALLAQLRQWRRSSFDPDPARVDALLQRLVLQGDSALAAIAAYLRSGEDLDLNAVPAGRVRHYTSLRLALFSVLEQIGGDRAEAIWFETLRRTQSAREIEVLGQLLERRAPGVYRQDLVDVASRQLQQLDRSLAEREDLAPLFRVLLQYGDASLVRELERLPEMALGRYAALTLARLPDDAGIEALSYRLAQDAPQSNPGARFALELLAQSADSPAAQAALLENARQQRIPDFLWPELGLMLAGTYRFELTDPRTTSRMAPVEVSTAGGRSIHSVNKFISFGPGGEQVLFGVRYTRPDLSAGQLAARLELIDRLLAEAQSPTAQHALEQAFAEVWSAYDKEAGW